MADIISSISSLVTPVATIYGLYWARNESKRWRNHKKIERQAEVAGKACVTATRYLNEMKRFSTLLQITNVRENETEKESHSRYLSEKWAEIEPSKKLFLEAWDLLAVYLPEESDCSVQVRIKASYFLRKVTTVISMQ